ncbi:MAG: aminomethyl-transferring glycine dehydrogenase [Bacteroidota bacterium]|jgi:glycine dehydrogenase
MSLFTQQRNEFKSRHIGPHQEATAAMLTTIGEPSLDSLIDKTVPNAIRMKSPLNLPAPMHEAAYLQHVQEMGNKNIVAKNFIGQGYYGTYTPSVILRTIFENPGWYTQYTPYQAEIAQGRLESLLNYQTMVSDLTGLPIANASLLDEATAASEAMTMFFNMLNKNQDSIERPKFFVDQHCFPQTIDVLKTRALPIGIELEVGDYKTASLDATYFGALVQYPNDKGSVESYEDFIHQVHQVGAYVAMATDLLALTLLKSPGELGADVALGSAQRFGVPMGFGGPHAAFFAVSDEFKRQIPGRIIGISIDANGNRALRMALQTREQHIKREKATSNICTAQALLANMAAMYAVYHGPQGLKAIATRIQQLTTALATSLKTVAPSVITVENANAFDTLLVHVPTTKTIAALANAANINFRYFNDTQIGISLDETTSMEDVNAILSLFAKAFEGVLTTASIQEASMIPAALQRNSAYLTHPVFNSHHSETQMMRYIKKLENRDLSLNTSMISLGSCTMKLNAASEMMPLSNPNWGALHPFAPAHQTLGYQEMAAKLSTYLCEITKFDACSLQPNSGAQGEYAGLLTIRNYHRSLGEQHRDVMLIPISAHGTNPASAVMAGYKVVVVKALDNGYIDIADLKEKAQAHAANLAGIMITYPSTYGVYEETVIEITDLIHQYGGQVYMDGANMNAQVGLTAPGLIGADVCHLNLHKTFAIPHGGGGPGMGPICVKAHLADHLPGHIHTNSTVTAVSAAPYGSASILLISYAYICMLGAEGVTDATKYAILNANYMRARLDKAYDILYTGVSGTCAHEFIVDLRPFKASVGIEAEDIAKRLIDYGFHAPTMSFPVAGTIMIEPTESEDKAELDRFCDALLAIREEIKAIENGSADKANNVLKHAPHTQALVCSSTWDRPYTREQAAFPLAYVSENKFWPFVSRINNTHGDRNLVCTCEPTAAYM